MPTTGERGEASVIVCAVCVCGKVKQQKKPNSETASLATLYECH